MSGLEITIGCAVGLVLVTWWLNRPVELWVWPWKPCHNCKRVWRRDEFGNLEFMTPLTWHHFKDSTEMCPRCEEAAEAIAEIERKTIV
jgi:hypothetical protein